jgi:dienelactone hydrolase
MRVFHVKPKLLVATVLLLAPGWALAQSQVRIPGEGIDLAGRLYVPAGEGPFPAIVLMHGCSGMWLPSGRPNRTYDDWARGFQERGFIALALDSFGPRGVKEICTQKVRTISEARDRPGDAFAAQRWLAAREDVRSDEIHLIGWSNGGSSVLHVLNAVASAEEGSPPPFRAAIAFYPGCANPRLRNFRPSVPLLIQAGAADDWTPAHFCQSLAERARAAGAPVEIDIYPEAHHAFDRLGGALRHRPEVRNQASASGWGATIGPNPVAREKARERTFSYLIEVR